LWKLSLSELNTKSFFCTYLNEKNVKSKHNVVNKK